MEATKVVTLKDEFKGLGIQSGQVYVQLSIYYTATVRNLEDFERLLNDSSELKDCLHIVRWSKSGLSQAFFDGLTSKEKQQKIMQLFPPVTQ